MTYVTWSTIFHMMICLQRVRLHFSRFEIGTHWMDKVNIYDGNSTAAPLIRSFSSERLPKDITSSGNTVFVYIVASEDGQFRIKYFETEGMEVLFI